ncbi:shikimate dehydrogenase [Pleionea sediminis]|uniref:shikimate dehydrogenase n=1 Tax=Pleionea sediminis TaxID=2569479 RepID=UPI0011860A02|nr:shikimate dehydrogenase [Pleionea sediminis]
MTRRFAVIGNPVDHSLSPLIHLSFADQFGIDLTYEKIFSDEQTFSEIVDDFFTRGGQGLNVTIPFKHKAFAITEYLSEAAKTSRSVNTLWKNEQNQLVGSTTDGLGFINSLTHHAFNLKDKTVLMLGAGGAALSIIPELLNHSARVYLINRTEQTALTLIEQFSGLGSIQLWKNCNTITPDLIINTMPQDGENWLTKLDVPLSDRQVIYDISYGARAEKFLNHCESCGVRKTIDGWGMLVEQAALSFKIWHGVQPDTKTLIANGPF